MKRASGLALAAAGVLFLTLAAYSYAYYYRFPYFDHLDLCIFLDLSFKGNLTLSSLFTPHGNSHWHAPAYFILIPLALWSQWNIVWDITVNLLVIALVWLVLRSQLRHTATRIGYPSLLPWGMLVAGFFLFSVNQAANSLWGWQVAVFLNLLGSLGGIVLLSREHLNARHLLGALLGGALATYSFSTGLAFWPIGLVLILAHSGAGRRRKILFGGVFLLCAVAVGLHYHDTVFALASKVGPIAHDHEASLLTKARFFLVHLGTPMAWFGEVQVNPILPVTGVRFLGATKSIGLTGILLLVGMAWYLNRRHGIAWSALAPFLAIASYAVGSALLTSFARITSGQEQGGSPRYTSFSNLLWMSVFILAVITLPRLPTWPKRILAGLLLVLTALMARTAVDIAHAHAENAVRHNALAPKLATMYPNIDDRTLLTVFPDLNRINHFLTVMHEKKLNLFRDPVSFITSIPLSIAGAKFEGISLLGASPLGVRFRGHGRNAHLILSVDAPLPEAFAVSLKVHFPDRVNGELHWGDGRGWTHDRGEPLTRTKIDGAYWFYFRRSGASPPVRVLKLGFRPARGEICDFEGVFQELKIWTR